MSEITKQRKAGQLAKAYELAAQYLSEDPDNIWSKRAMAWVLYDYAKQSTLYESRTLCVQYLEQICALQLPPEEHILHDSLAWCIRALVAQSANESSCDTDFYNHLFSLLRTIPFTIPSEAYSALLQAFLRLKVQWIQFDTFCEWWNFDHLRAEDFQSQKSENSKMMMSLAERAFMAYSKALLAKNNEGQMRQWSAKLAELVKRHPNYIYLPYYLTQLWIKLGEKAQAVETLLPFIKKKQNDFWVWELLGDTQDDEGKRFACYCKAIDCPSKEEMKVALREKMAVILYNKGLLAEAKAEFSQVIAIRKQHQWRIGDSLMQYMEAERMRQVPCSEQNAQLYRRYMEVAEELVLGKLQTYTILLTHYNSDKQFYSFITSDYCSGFFKYHCRNKNKLAVNEVVRIRCKEILEGRPTVVKSVDTEVTEEEKDKFYKRVSGKLQISDKGFGFVSNIFIEKQFIQLYAKGALVTVTAIPAYDKGKKRWGWKAIEVRQD